MALNLKGRILIGLSNNGEGINGTLAGLKEDLDAYVDCMLGKGCSSDDPRRRDAVNKFRLTSKQFFDGLNAPELLLDSPNDFKWSSHSADATSSNEDGDDEWFPDLNIKIVKEIISTGGEFSNITTTETSVGYLTPREWHEEIKSLVEKKQQAKSNADNDNVGDDNVDTVLIDVRNHKECQIGSFAPGISIDPNTKTFAQFPKWVRDNAGNDDSAAAPGKDATTSSTAAAQSSLLQNKRILLYCTGGIRCEKASAFVRQMVPQNKGIFHLKGGIHKYLEEYGNSSGESQFVGKNFVFDRRGALHANECGKHSTDSNNYTTDIVGKCIYCKEPYDTFSHENVCTVCREPLLVCTKCKSELGEKQQCAVPEFHCEDHFHLSSCYFTNLSGFSVDDLKKQLEELNAHLEPLLALKKKGKQRRKSVRKQINKLEAFIHNLLENGHNDSSSATIVCRHCGSSSCDKKCWGFHGGNKCILNKLKTGSDVNEDDTDPPSRNKKRTRTPSNQRPSKVLKREKDLSEIEALQLCQAPSQHRALAGLRCPPPVIRRLSSSVKGRWCGQTLRHVLSTEFGLKNETLDQLLAAGLVHINGMQQSLDTILQNGDRISRIVHWHEPPVCVQAKISVTKHRVSELFQQGEGSSSADAGSFLYVIDKPATVPIYPAGPFYANSLLSMVEAQEGLPPKSLLPCHRLDRCTSGVLLCTNTSSAASLVQRHLKGKEAKKLYLARVKGQFPSKQSEILDANVPNSASLHWSDGTIEVSAPISVQLEDSSSDDMLKRFVSPDGKPSVSRFRFLSYDKSRDLSIIACSPVTGRGHQLRVHLQLLGFPIHNDVTYGGLMADEEKEQLMNISIDAVLETSAKNVHCLREDSVSLEEAESAIKMCSCCSAGSAGLKASFKDNQLLGSGASIDLHAAKYCIDSDNESKATFVAGVPHWAMAAMKDDLQWLN